MRLQMFEPPTLFKTPTPCRSCGYKALYWQKHEGKWMLHHWGIIYLTPETQSGSYLLTESGNA